MNRNTLHFASLLIVVGLSGIWPLPVCMAQENLVQEGRNLLLDYAFLPRDFHQSTFDELWKDWPEPLRSQAEQASAAERRKMAFDRFGLSGRRDAPEKPLQYVVDKEGWWSMNCFAC
ncbi:MAG: cytochrome c, partial [Planctomycetaceae bacterium]|nr:cytochrome c [Planctomycetaceae bacterium]